MALIKIIATWECDGCGTRMEAELDPAEKIATDLYAEAEEAIRGGASGILSSVQGGKMLCPACTTIVDSFVTEDRNATADEVDEALEGAR